MVRRKEGDYPSSISDGNEVYFDTGTTATDTGLSPGTTYFYRAWSEITGSQQWSDGYASDSATTDGGEEPVPVGGQVYHTDKNRILAPWLVLLSCLVFITIAIYSGARGQVRD
jgi:hypothetical protein